MAETKAGIQKLRDESRKDASMFSDYSLVSHLCSKAVKPNALYRMVERMRRENHPTLKDYSIHALKTERRSAFLIRFPEKPIYFLFDEQNYDFVERHLAIDEVYAELDSQRGSAGFSGGHYTEVYHHKVSGSKKIMHCYFNQYGEYGYCFFKERDENIKVLDNYLIDLIKANSRSAGDLYNAIAHEKDIRLSIALQEADQLETRLTDLSRDPYQPNFYGSYQDLSKQFIEKIEAANQLSENVLDMRGARIREIVALFSERKNLGNEVKKPKVPLQKPETKTQVATEAVKDSSLAEKSVADPMSSLLNLAEKLNTLIKEKVRSVANRIKAHKLNQEISMAIISLPPRVLRVQKNKAAIKTIQTSLKSLPSLKSFFYDCCLQGDVEAAKEIYAELKESVNIFFYYHFLKTIAIAKDASASQLTAYLQICEFFFEHSESYRLCVRLASYTLNHNSEQNIGFSCLFQAAYSGLGDVFKMFLKHGMKPGIGILSNNIEIPLINAITCCVESPEYLEILLDLGISSEMRSTTLKLSQDFTLPKKHSFSKKTVELLKQSHQRMMKLSNQASLNSALSAAIENVARFQSCIELAGNVANHKMVSILLKHSSFKSILLSLCNVIDKQGIINRVIPVAKESGLILCANKADADQVSASLYTLKSDKIASIIFPKDERDKETIDYFVVMKMLNKAFNETYDEISRKSPELLEQIYNILLKEAQAFETAGRFMQARNCYHACNSILFRKKAFTLSDRQKSMQLFCLIGKVSLAMNKGDDPAFYYLRAASLICNKELVDQFNDIPIYRWVRKRLEERGIPIPFSAPQFMPSFALHAAEHSSAVSDSKGGSLLKKCFRCCRNKKR